MPEPPECSESGSTTSPFICRVSCVRLDRSSALGKVLDGLDHTFHKIAVKHCRHIVSKHRIQVVGNLLYAHLPVSKASLTGQIEHLKKERDNPDWTIPKFEQLQDA